MKTLFHATFFFSFFKFTEFLCFFSCSALGKAEAAEAGCHFNCQSPPVTACPALLVNRYLCQQEEKYTLFSFLSTVLLFFRRPVSTFWIPLPFYLKSFHVSDIRLYLTFWRIRLFGHFYAQQVNTQWLAFCLAMHRSTEVANRLCLENRWFWPADFDFRAL